jgi:acetoin utilization protein AcuB
VPRPDARDGTRIADPGRARRSTRVTEEADMIASELMTPQPRTATPETTVAEVWDLMRELDVRHVPVVERGALVGVLSDRDLAQLKPPRLLTPDGADRARELLATPIAALMTRDVVAIEPDLDVDELIGLLIELKVGALPVVRPDTREVIGIVSYIDVLTALQEVLAERD